MDSASVSGAEGCGFKSHLGRYFFNKLRTSKSFTVALTASLDRFVQPLDSLSVFPFTLLLCSALLVLPNSDTMLQVVTPRTDILVAIFIGQSALTFFLATAPVTKVDETIVVHQLTLAVKLICNECSLVGFI